MENLYEMGLRLLAATAAGVALGLNRDLRGKPTGVRTLGLVALGSALVTVAALDAQIGAGRLSDHPDAASRVVQGVIQGILSGIGFIGAGVILHDQSRRRVRGLTTAAAVWVTAGIGIVCGLGAWSVVGIAMALVLAVLVFGGWAERTFQRLVKGAPEDPPDQPDEG
jgi:putative Mg2+ transporter-C (MgtC) family protein